MHLFTIAVLTAMEWVTGRNMALLTQINHHYQ